jgi:hypothetical protein
MDLMAQARIYERDTDSVFLRNFRKNETFGKKFAELIGLGSTDGSVTVRGQTRHRVHSGSIDIEISFGNRVTLLIENKIDAGYSSTVDGLGQPERYRASVDELQRSGISARSVLLAPEAYFVASRTANLFDKKVSYEAVLDFLDGDDAIVITEAIQEASTPYEPVANSSTGGFFESYRQLVSERFPDLKMKRNPNSGGIRPTESRTVYFDVASTLVSHTGVPKPRMSLQCWDSSAPSASVKIMIGGWGWYLSEFAVPETLRDIGGYLRPAGKSIGIVIDTPRLETQKPYALQLENITEGLEAALRLQKWWRTNGETLRAWAKVTSRGRKDAQS